MSAIQALLESDHGKAFVEANTEILAEAEMAANDFRKTMKAFILQNPREFLGESLEATAKNIRVFSEVSTAQFLTEISSICGDLAEVQTPVTEGGLSDYL